MIDVLWVFMGPTLLLASSNLLPKKTLFERSGVWGEKDQTVVEQGLQETAEAALQQIKDKNYVAEFADQRCRFVLAVGISFVGKQLATAYERLA